VTEYGRANLPWELNTTPSNISYLYDAADMRVYKKEAPKGKGGNNSLKEEWYLRVGGQELAIFNISTGKLTWFVHGSERIAKIEHQLNGDEIPAIISGAFGDYGGGQEPEPRGEEPESEGENAENGNDPFDDLLILPSNPPVPNVVFYTYDHLGNTRVTYSTAIDCGEPTSVTYTLETAMDYYPYGKLLREYANGQQERYVSTQHERDKETGLDYRGARFYDSDVARFLSLDPLATEYPSLSDYVYVADNPLIFIDPDGRAPQDIIVPKEDQDFVLKNLHARTKARYTFNENNELIKDNSVEQGSDAYSEKINQAIVSNNKMVIQKKQNIYKSDWGIDVSIDAFFGGAVTQDGQEGYFDKDDKFQTRRVATVNITGSESQDILDKEGNSLNYTSADILLHEIIGHAMAILGYPDTGNAVDNENKVRKELGLKERKKEEDHPE